MKTNLKFNAILMVLFVLLMGSFACEKEQMISEKENYVSILKVAEDGTTSVIEANLQAVLLNTPPISDEEMTLLLEMKEEEKLARDVYYVLYEKFGRMIFSNIAKAEERHLNAVIMLLKYYGSADTLIAETGSFTNPEFQELYNELVLKGSVTFDEALMTGALIEEMDIKDLNQCLSTVTNENIILVFENLLKGSRNHLRAFVRQLTQLGLSYNPVYISVDEFEQIITSPMEKGNQCRKNGKGNGRNNGNGRNKGNGRQGG